MPDVLNVSLKMNLSRKSRKTYLFIKYQKLNNFRKYSHSEICSAKKFEQIPGPYSLPFVGTLYQYLPILGHYQFDRLHRNGFKKLAKFGPVVRETIVPDVNIVWLFDPVDIQTMYECEGKYPERRSHLALEKYRLDKSDLYNSGGLLPTNGPEWFRLRSIFQKSLSNLNSVRNFLPQSEKIIQEWIEHLLEISSIENMDYLPVFSRLFLELTCMTAFDMRLNSFSKSELKPRSRSSRLMRAAVMTNSCILGTDNGPQLWRKFNTPSYKRLIKAQEYMEEIAVDLLSQKMTFFDDSKSENKTVSLLEGYLSSPELDLKDIVGIAADFLLAGIDTTSYTCSFLFYHIANNQLVQNRLYEESCELLKNRNETVTKNVLNNCPYARAVLKESLRLNPVSVGTGRILNVDAVFSGYQVPKGTVIVSQNQISCRLPQYISDPLTFRPERWLRGGQDFQTTHPFLVLPFGHGPRSCIARRLAEQNLLTVLLKTVRNFQIEWNGSELDTKSLLINKPDKPVTLVFKYRND